MGSKGKTPSPLPQPCLRPGSWLLGGSGSGPYVTSVPWGKWLSLLHPGPRISEVEEIAPWVKNFLFKYEHLSSGPQYLCEKPGVAGYVCHLSTGSRDRPIQGCAGLQGPELQVQ